MLVVGRRRQSKPIEVALDIGGGGAVLILVGVMACKVSHNLFSCNSPRARKRLAYLLMTLQVGGWGAHQTIFSVACNSNSGILASLQTVETVVHTQRYRLDANKFPMFSVRWT